VDILEKRNVSFTAGIRTPYCPVRGLTTIPTNGLIGRSEGMRLLGKPRSRWEGKISCNITVLYRNGRGPKGAYWVRVAQDKTFVNMVMNILREIFDWMSDYQLLEKGSDCWKKHTHTYHKLTCFILYHSFSILLALPSGVF